MEKIEFLSSSELEQIHGGVTAIREIGRSVGRYLSGLWDGLTGE